MGDQSTEEPEKKEQEVNKRSSVCVEREKWGRGREGRQGGSMRQGGWGGAGGGGREGAA